MPFCEFIDCIDLVRRDGMGLIYKEHTRIWTAPNRGICHHCIINVYYLLNSILRQSRYCMQSTEWQMANLSWHFYRDPWNGQVLTTWVPTIPRYSSVRWRKPGTSSGSSQPMTVCWRLTSDLLCKYIIQQLNNIF